MPRLSPPSPRLRRLLTFGLLEAAVLFLVAEVVFGVTAAARPTGTPDFIAYYTGARIAVAGQASQLYDLALQARVESRVLGFAPGSFHPFYFINPPYMALLLAPLGRLDYQHAWATWSGLSLVSIVGALVLLVRSLDIRGLTAWAVGLAFLDFTPILATLLHGQGSGVVLLGVVACWYLIVRDRPLAAGAALGLGLVKPQLLLPILVLLVASRAWRTLAGLGAVTLAAVTLATAAYGLEPWIAYLGFTLPAASGTAARIGGSIDTGVSIRALNDALGLPSSVGVVACYAALAAFGVYVARRRSAGVVALYPLATLLALVASPHSGYHDAVLILLPLGWVALPALTAPSIGRIGVFGLTIAACLALSFTDLVALVPPPLTAVLLLALTAAMTAWPAGGGPAGTESPAPGRVSTLVAP